jgi:hypothetical protein
MSAEATLQMEQDGAAAPSSVVAVSVVADPSNPTTPFSNTSDGALSTREQLIAQMQLMQQRIAQLERLVEEMAARPSDGASVTAAPAAPIRFSDAALCTCTPRQQQSTLPLSTRFSIGHRLHKDALHCVLAFLPLKGLPLVMRSCRAWAAAVRSLPLRDDSLSVSSRQLYQLPLSASTPLARHIVTCDV